MWWSLFGAAIPWQIDATATLAPSASALVSSTAASPYAMALAAADASLWTRIIGSRSLAVVDWSGHYGRPIFATGTQLPPQDIATRGRARLDLVAMPTVNLAFSADGFISSRIGLRASDELVLRDPFSANRVLDGWSAQSSIMARATPTSALRFDLRYAQMGAIAADVPAAVGIDTHAITATASATIQVSRRFFTGPVTRIGLTHFNHALVDVNFSRGPADVASLAVLGFARLDMTPKTRVSLTAGATFASAPPGIEDRKTIVSPDVRLEVRSMGGRTGATLVLAFGYQAVGPRIGFGTDYSGLLDVWARPFRGSDRRDVYLHCIARARAAQSLLVLPANAATSADASGTLSTRSGALGISMSRAHALGWFSNAGVDFELVSARVEPEAIGGDPPISYRVLFSVGIAASVSTDRRRLLARDPLLPAYDERSVSPVRAVRRADTSSSDELGPFEDGED